MSHEQPTIESGNDNKKERTKQEFRDFLAEQIDLPMEQWNEEFKEYVRGKTIENRAIEDNKENVSEKEKQREVFERYLERLDLSVEDLRNKKILDLGSGEEGRFIKECIDKNITEDVYGLDLELPKHAEEKYRGHLFKGDFEKASPIKSPDYIFSVGAVSAEHQKTLENALKELKEGGEIRIYPIVKPSKGEGLEGAEESYAQWQGMLQKFSREENIQWEMRPLDIKVSGKDNDIWLEEVLIIKKNKE